jgi:enamine deaminase RidA (YjgF/YER057c/UK114 family)
VDVETRLEKLGLVLPEPMQLPPGVELPFAWVRVRGNRAYVSGHGPLNPDGSLCGPFGKVGTEVSSEVSPEEGYEAARGCALSVLASLKRELGDLDRVTAWLVVHGLVNAASDLGGSAGVVNGFSDLILALYGPEAGTHARTAPGVATLPLNHAVFVAAEVKIAA